MISFCSLKKLENLENDLNSGEHTSQYEIKLGLFPFISCLLTVDSKVPVLDGTIRGPSFFPQSHSSVENWIWRMYEFQVRT